MNDQDNRRSAFAVCTPFGRCLFSPPLPSPLAADVCVSGLLCGGHRENNHNNDLLVSGLEINRLSGEWLAKRLIALRFAAKRFRT